MCFVFIISTLGRFKPFYMYSQCLSNLIVSLTDNQSLQFSHKFYVAEET